MIETATQTPHWDLLPSPRSYFQLNYCYSLLKCIKIFLVVVFSMLFGRHSKFPTCIKVIVPFVDVQVLHQALNYSSWRLSIEVLQNQSFSIAAFCCLPRRECTIVVQRDHCYLVITFFFFFGATAVQSHDSENNGTILCSHYFLFHQFFSSPNFIKQLICPMLFCIDGLQSVSVRQQRQISLC